MRRLVALAALAVARGRLRRWGRPARRCSPPLAHRRLRGARARRRVQLRGLGRARDAAPRGRPRRTSTRPPSPRHPDELLAEGLVEAPRVFATNRLVLVVPADNPAGIGSVADLEARRRSARDRRRGRPGRRLHARRARELGDGVARRACGEPRRRTCAACSRKVALGEADAGFVYATDVAAGGDDVRGDRAPARGAGGGRATRSRSSRTPSTARRPRRSSSSPARRATGAARSPRAGSGCRETPVRARRSRSPPGSSLAFLLLPLVALFLRVPPGELVAALGSEAALDALWVTAQDRPDRARASSSASGLRPPTCWRRAASAAGASCWRRSSCRSCCLRPSPASRS